MACNSQVLKLIDDTKQVERAYNQFYEILIKGSEDLDDCRQLKNTDVRFRRLKKPAERIHIDFWVGSSTDAALQINQPRLPMSENGASHVAIDETGRRWIIRQGDIHGNANLERLRGAEFTKRTGFPQLDVKRGTASATKQWHAVVCLDQSSRKRFCAETAEFIRSCWNARAYGAQAESDNERLAALLGKPERGGWYDALPNSTPRSVMKIQGAVYEELERVLSEAGIRLKKPRHAAGYEVDAVVEGERADVLIEIKTGKSPYDVYCGIGQLNIYPKMLRGLSRCPRVLLLPDCPPKPMMDAIEECGIELHQYEYEVRDKRATVRFSDAFLLRCGMTQKQIAALEG